MDARKILQDLQYRINTTPESDPDYEKGKASPYSRSMELDLTNDPKQLTHHV